MILAIQVELSTLLIGVPCAIAGGIALLVLMPWFKMRQSRNWAPVPGKIISSSVVQREVTTDFQNDTKELRNFPAVTFEYEVGGRTFQGSRHSFLENRGNVDVPETLARYPRGSAVTVFYDPADPRRSVIEREMPEGTWRMLAYIFGGLAVGTAILVFGVDGLAKAVRSYQLDPRRAGPAIFLAIAGLVLLRMAFYMRNLAGTARSWPKAKGRISASRVEAVGTRNNEDRWNSVSRSAFRSRITYTYSVGAHQYTNERVTFGWTLSSTLAGLVTGHAKRYSPGDAVDVSYNPAQPIDAVLECRVAGLWFLWLMVLVCLISAALLVSY